MNNKNSTTAAHLLHSRLQLIKSRLKINGIREPGNFIEANYHYLTEAVKSVANYHHLVCDENDIMQASCLFLYSMIPEVQYTYYVVNHSHGPDAKAVTSPDNGKTLILADPNDRLSEEEAREMLEAMRVWHGIGHLSLGRKYVWRNDRI